jgi:hypothetical protein
MYTRISSWLYFTYKFRLIPNCETAPVRLTSRHVRSVHTRSSKCTGFSSSLGWLTRWNTASSLPFPWDEAKPVITLVESSAAGQSTPPPPSELVRNELQLYYEEQRQTGQEQLIAGQGGDQSCLHAMVIALQQFILQCGVVTNVIMGLW